MSSGFVKESELEEVRRKRQEEWEKVRNADDPEGFLFIYLFIYDVKLK